MKMKTILIIVISLAIGFAAGSEFAFMRRRLQTEVAPERTTAIKKSVFPVTFEGATPKKLVALTFDDGPNPRFTPKILGVLNREHVKATFFVTGENALAYPALIKQEARSGHMVENHTWNHPEFELLSSDKMMMELKSTSNEIRKLTGKKPQYFRPPYGILTRKVYLEAALQDLQIILWSNTLQDVYFQRPAQAAASVISAAQPGAIILAHDGGRDRTRVIEALPMLIRRLKARGYRFVTVGQMPLPQYK